MKNILYLSFFFERSIFIRKSKKKKKLMKFGKSKAFVRLLLFEKRLMLIWNENYKMIKNKERTGLDKV